MFKLSAMTNYCSPPTGLQSNKGLVKTFRSFVCKQSKSHIYSKHPLTLLGGYLQFSYGTHEKASLQPLRLANIHKTNWMQLSARFYICLYLCIPASIYKKLYIVNLTWSQVLLSQWSFIYRSVSKTQDLAATVSDVFQACSTRSVFSVTCLKWKEAARKRSLFWETGLRKLLEACPSFINLRLE